MRSVNAFIFTCFVKVLRISLVGSQQMIIFSRECKSDLFLYITGRWHWGLLCLFGCSVMRMVLELAYFCLVRGIESSCLTVHT